MIGYPAGIITGITYGLNPLFGIPLMNEGGIRGVHPVLPIRICGAAARGFPAAERTEVQGDGQAGGHSAGAGIAVHG